ncbi:MAG: efflux RND transporter periplasmic adaptor subunit [Pseudomonadota bacterium]
MRIISFLTAIVVMVALYFLVLQRDTALEFAGAEAVPDMTEASTEPTEEMDKAISVVARRSNAQVIDSAVIVRGRTEAARQVDVRAETSGLVISDPLRKGASVEAGQLMCALDVGTRDVALVEAQARLSEAQAGLADAEINQRAAARLSEDGFASETRVTAANAAVQSARAAVQSAEAGIAAAEKELERLQIHAPFGGLLESDTAEIGSLLQPGALCGTVIQLNPIKLVGFVPETEVDRVTVGAQAAARLASGREVLGAVTFLSRSADMTTRTFRVEVEVDNSDLTIRDGQTAEIIVASDGAEAHLLPQSALTLNDTGRLGVRLVAEDNRAAFAPVSVLRDTTEGIWVGGLDEEVAVIVVGQEFVTDGVSVAPTFEEASQ